jgi:uncharacterized SAM-binding protein YcdF (DUF218 family)
MLICSIPIALYINEVTSYDQYTVEMKPKDAAIILGAATRGEKPSPALQERIEMAKELYEKKLVRYIILSGGLGNFKFSTEAQVMKAYLLKAGVPHRALLVEKEARNTEENLSYSAQILRKYKMKSAYIVTHDYHMYRALQYARKAGIQATPAPVHSEVLFTPYHKVRECFALSKWKLSCNYSPVPK